MQYEFSGGGRPYTLPKINAAPLSAIIVVGALVLLVVTLGMREGLPGAST
ncbi:MAG: hypothetical protein AAF639_34825 [Chloroflexota bacterium]